MLTTVKISQRVGGEEPLVAALKQLKQAVRLRIVDDGPVEPLLGLLGISDSPETEPAAVGAASPPDTQSGCAFGE